MKKALLIFLALAISFFAVQINAENTVKDRPEVSAHSAVLIDARSGEVLFEKNADEKMGMASTTKIMTALIVAELCRLDDTVCVSAQAAGTEGSSVYLREGETVSVEYLLYALLLASANDAAAALAIHVSGSIEGFAALMNDKANQLGLCNTHFTNPHGLYDAEHYTTARELAIISREALKSETVRKIASTYKTTVKSADGNTRVLVNHNKLLRLYDGAIGLKTGFTKKTGRTLVSAAERDGLTLIAVTLNAPDDWNDHTKMLDYGFSNYTRAVMLQAGELCYALPIGGGREDFVYLTNSEEIALTVRKGNEQAARDSYEVQTRSRLICAPIYGGEELGAIVYEYGAQCALSPLTAIGTVDQKEEKGALKRLFEKIKMKTEIK